MLLIATGHGKGKTTSALGLALRAAGWDKKTAIVFFDKGGTHYGEQKILDHLKGKIDSYRFGLTRFDEKTQTFRFKNTIKDKAEALKALKKVEGLMKKKYFLIIGDELINCLNLGLITAQAVKKTIDLCPPEIHLLLTGRNAPTWLINKADLVSEMAEIKHYYKDKKKAIKGIDF